MIVFKIYSYVTYVIVCKPRIIPICVTRRTYPKNNKLYLNVIGDITLLIRFVLDLCRRN